MKTYNVEVTITVQAEDEYDATATVLYHLNDIRQIEATVTCTPYTWED